MELYEAGVLENYSSAPAIWSNKTTDSKNNKFDFESLICYYLQHQSPK